MNYYYELLIIDFVFIILVNILLNIKVTVGVVMNVV